MKTKQTLTLTISFVLAYLAIASGQSTFTKVTGNALVTNTNGFGRGVWGDFNNDGLLDFFAPNFSGGIGYFYRNDGGGNFTSITQGAPVQASNSPGTDTGDYDNDGYLDLLVASGAGNNAVVGGHTNALFHNLGDGTFSQVSGGDVTNQVGYFDACAWADYDNDGWLDFLVTDVGPNFGGAKNRLLHNNGDGTFSNVTSGPVVTDVGISESALWADYDNDGFDDLLVLQDIGSNFLYHNNRDGTFIRIHSNPVGTDQWPAGVSGAAWGDYDNDGFQDLFVTSYNGSTNRLYHNNHDGTFTNVTSAPMLSRPAGTDSVGCQWGDYDNDGYLDLFVSSNNGKNALYHNNGNGTFTKILTGNPVNDGGTGLECYLCPWVDYDNDGFLDLFVQVGTANTFPKFMYHNDGNANAWLEVKLVGTVANRSAIGAKVRVHATIGGKTFWQMREINTGGGRSVQPLLAHFGLGDATNVDTVRIEWPSGTVQEFQNVSPKQILTYIEPPRLLAATPGGVPQISLKGGRGFQYEIESSPDLTTWSAIGTVTITNLDGKALIVDPNPPASDQRFYRAVSH